VDLKSLPNNGDVSPQEFSQLFEARLRSTFPRAMRVLITLGPRHSFSVANVIHLGLQKGIVNTIIEALEEWCELFPKAPDLITAHVDTKHYFAVMYGQYFMTPSDTVNELGPFEVIDDNGRFRTLGIKQTRLWTPGTPDKGA
jgi:hypothetical protein